MSQATEESQLSSNNINGDVVDFVMPQATSSSHSSLDQTSHSMFNVASASSFDQVSTLDHVSYPQMNTISQPLMQPFASPLSMLSLSQSSSQSSTLFPLTQSFVPTIEEPGLMMSSPPSFSLGDTRTPTSDHTCPICGNEAGRHNHYGGRGCTSCRAFFRRSVQVWVKRLHNKPSNNIWEFSYYPLC